VRVVDEEARCGFDVRRARFDHDGGLPRTEAVLSGSEWRGSVGVAPA